MQMFLRIPLGSLSDRVGRKPLIMFGLICFSLTQLLFFLSQNLWILLLGLVTNGFALAFFYPSSQSCASELAPKGKLGETMGRFTMSVGFAFAIGPLIGGYLTQLFPSYRVIFLLGFVFTSLGAIFTKFLMVETLPQLSSTGWTNEMKLMRKQINEIPKTLWSMFKNRWVLASSITVFVSSFGLAALESYYPLYAQNIGYDESLIGAYLALRSFTWTFSMPFLGKLSDKVGRSIPIVVGLIMSAIGSVFLPIVGDYVLLLLFVLVGLGGGLSGPASQAIIAEGTGSGRRGVAMGLYGTMLMGGRGIGIFVTGMVVSILGLVWAFYMGALVVLLGVMVILIMKK